MNICKYCKSKGMNLNEYENFVNNIKSAAMAIKSQLKYNGGMYYKTSDLFNWNQNTNEDIQLFIIQELKNLDIEFIENNKYYRVCD